MGWYFCIWLSSDFQVRPARKANGWGQDLMTEIFMVLDSFGVLMVERRQLPESVLGTDIEGVRRNPVLANLFQRMSFMERRGSGLRKICHETMAKDNYEDRLGLRGESWTVFLCCLLEGWRCVSGPSKFPHPPLPAGSVQLSSKSPMNRKTARRRHKTCQRKRGGFRFNLLQTRHPAPRRKVGRGYVRAPAISRSLGATPLARFCRPE